MTEEETQPQPAAGQRRQLRRAAVAAGQGGAEGVQMCCPREQAGESAPAGGHTLKQQGTAREQGVVRVTVLSLPATPSQMSIPEEWQMTPTPTLLSLVNLMNSVSNSLCYVCNIPWTEITCIKIKCPSPTERNQVCTYHLSRHLSRENLRITSEKEKKSTNADQAPSASLHKHIGASCGKHSDGPLKPKHKSTPAGQPALPPRRPRPLPLLRVATAQRTVYLTCCQILKIFSTSIGMEQLNSQFAFS